MPREKKLLKYVKMKTRQRPFSRRQQKWLFLRGVSITPEQAPLKPRLSPRASLFSATWIAGLLSEPSLSRHNRELHAPIYWNIIQFSENFRNQLEFLIKSAGSMSRQHKMFSRLLTNLLAYKFSKPISNFRIHFSHSSKSFFENDYNNFPSKFLAVLIVIHFVNYFKKKSSSRESYFWQIARRNLEDVPNFRCEQPEARAVGTPRRSDQKVSPKRIRNPRAHSSKFTYKYIVFYKRIVYFMDVNFHWKPTRTQGMKPSDNNCFQSSCRETRFLATTAFILYITLLLDQFNFPT